MSSEHPVLLTVEDRVAVISFNRPDKLNAVGGGLPEAWHDAVVEVKDRDDVNAVVLTGEGRAFCAGLDLESDFGGSGGDAAEVTHQRMRRSVETILMLREMRQPVIAAVNGAAVGGGFAYTLACDIRIAGTDMKMIAPFANIGMSAGDLGLTWLLPRLIGAGAAAQVFYTGAPISADRALSMGLVEEVVENPRGRAVELAREIAAKPPFGIQHSKELLNASIYGQGYREHLEMEMRSQVICSLSGAFAEAKTKFAGSRRK